MTIETELNSLLDLPDSEIKERLRSVIEQLSIKKLNTSIKRAKLPNSKTLSQYTFNLQPQIESDIRKLANCDFIPKGQNIMIIGRNGLGKTHLGTAIGIEAIKKGFSVLFTTYFDFISNCEKHKDKAISKYLKPQLLIFDEVGITKITGKSAEYFYKLVSKRSDAKKSIIFTSNVGTEDWAEDNVNSVAIMDRVLGDLHIVKLKVVGDSKRKNIISVIE